MRVIRFVDDVIPADLNVRGCFAIHDLSKASRIGILDRRLAVGVGVIVLIRDNGVPTRQIMTVEQTAGLR